MGSFRTAWLGRVGDEPRPLAMRALGGDSFGSTARVPVMAGPDVRSSNLAGSPAAWSSYRAVRKQCRPVDQINRIARRLHGRMTRAPRRLN